MQADQHRQLLFVRQLLQDGQQLDLAFHVQKRRWLVQQDHFRLLADRPRQQDPLPLAIADAVEIPVGKVGRAHPLQCCPHLPPILIRQDAQPPGVGDAPGRNKLETGGQLHRAGVRRHQSHFLCPGGAGIADQILTIQQHRAAQRSQLPRKRFEQGGFARAVRPDQGQDLAPPDAQRDLLRQRRFAVTDGKTAGLAQKILPVVLG